MPKEFKVGVQYSRAQIVSNTFDKEKGTFDIVFATETPVFRNGWEEKYNEVLLCDPANVRMDRINAGISLLNTHPDYSGRVKPEDVMGKISNVRFEKREMVGTVTLGAQCTESTRADLESGILDTFSVGYMIYKGSREEDNTTNQVTYKMTDWEPNHVAIAPIPADINSKIRDKENNNALIIENYLPKNNTKMTIVEIRAKATDEQKVRLEAIIGIARAAKLSDERTIELYYSEKTVDAIRSENPEVKEPVQVDVEGIRSAATKEQKDRFDAILKSTRAAKMDDSKAIEFFQSEKSIENIRQEVVEDFAKRDPKNISISQGVEAIDKKSRAIEASILHRVSPAIFGAQKIIIGGSETTIAEAGSEYRSMTLLEIGKELLTERGINHRGMSKAEVAAKVFGGRSMSTGDFPLLLENVANKALRADYQLAPEYWDLISRQTTVSDFKAKSMYQIGSANSMKEMPEGAEIKYGKLLEAKQTIKVKSYAEGLLFTRQMFINDDLSAFEQIPQKFVRDWNMQRGDLVWGMITGNVKMDDNKNLFSTDHANLAGTAALVTDVSLTAALVSYKAQTDLAGNKIRVQPKFLIVSSEYEITARKLLTVIAPTTSGDVNVWASMGLTLIVEPRLSGKAWYLTADPNAIEGLYYAYLDGNGGLRSNREDEFNTDSIKFGVRGEFGVAAIDYRGWFKNAGE